MKKIFLVLALILLSQPAFAGFSKSFKESFEAKFIPAIPHRGLVTGAEPINMDKIKTVVIVQKDRLIPAERAFFLIKPDEYDYRGAVVDGDSVKTRMGKIYTHLQSGTPMAVVNVIYSGKHVYLKLISLNQIFSDWNPKLQPSNVTVELGFKIEDPNDVDAAIAEVSEWVKPK